MAGGFEPIDPEQCQHYAHFAAHLNRTAFDGIYWSLFVFVIIMLFLASWKYSGTCEALANSRAGTKHYRHKMQRCLLICTGYFLLSIIALVMEVYALLALQFCDGEDLMSLYWSTWTMLQVGSLIAILGIILATFNAIRDRKNPPWALALGTPVLVVAGIGHAFHGAMRKRVQRVRSRSLRSRSRGRSESSLNGISTNDLPMSREETIRVEERPSGDNNNNNNEYRAKLLGYTPEGAPILQFVDDPGNSIDPERGTILGKNTMNGQIIVAFKKSMIMVSDGNSSDLSTPNEKAAASPSSLLVPPPVPLPSPRPPPVVRIAAPCRPSDEEVDEAEVHVSPV
ncbi:hypothetical protein GE21DRAFT_1123 [Neurospora crassa]|uniref:Uncharacterized protein n=1 Tax=Neurospora crassa (strain ATCC 24698 / 74-OR23-1A / CBS 708.71 / DSM 1257 / FGSC 987) TaxID=367110 RepID=A7UW92_NEUCR|nr:hypothetical protein NCU10595 [Neurospora crassa OR74A]EDO65289.1 hypothetical protein NCU10595 [Neurospora crassa OR74A]KHE78260.1 hypothetical protein GE21DRAFT_1123 [Neurospora crassa]|eukprot:XP_001728380.1 hypothetical protein NCU10595 [Neurospora crassa OR74A]